MSAIYDHDSITERVLYSPHKALDAVLDLGAIPKRLFRVFYRNTAKVTPLRWLREQAIAHGVCRIER